MDDTQPLTQFEKEMIALDLLHRIQILKKVVEAAPYGSELQRKGIQQRERIMYKLGVENI